MAVTLRAGIVGAGLMGRWHAHAARRTGVRVTAVVDSDVARAERLAARHRGCRAASRLGELIDLVDVVHICSPTSTHVTLAREALAAGRHLLVEKPLAPTAAETAALLTAAETAGVLVCPVHQFLFQKGVERALSCTDRIGPLQHADIVMCSAGADGLDGTGRDRVATEILPHPLSLLERVVPAGLREVRWSVEHPAAGEIRLFGRSGRLTASVIVSMASRPPVSRMELLGGRATIVVDLFHGFSVTLGGAASRAGKLTRPFVRSGAIAGVAAANLARRAFNREPAYPGLRRLFELFYEAASGRGPAPIGPAETLDVAGAWEDIGRRIMSR